MTAPARSSGVFAAVWPVLAAAGDRAGLAARRRQLLQGLTGTVLELGAGDGRNFLHYPPSVTRVLAVEPDHRLRARAQGAASRAPVPVTVVDGHADAIPAAAGSMDTVVLSLVMCSVADLQRAAAEVRRVVTPGGQVRLLEHVASPSPAVAPLQRLADRAWPQAFGGCHTSRDPVAALEKQGFAQHAPTLRFVPWHLRFTPVAPHVLAALRAPSPQTTASANACTAASSSPQARSGGSPC